MDQSTPIKDLPFNKQQQQINANSANQNVIPTQMPQNPMAVAGTGPPQPINTGEDSVAAAARFAQMPQQGALQKPVTKGGVVPKPGGPGQGISSPLKPTAAKKEYFGLADTDYKSTIVVFALVLIFSSSIFFDFLKTYLPVVSFEGKTTLIGSLISAVIASIIFIVIKIVAKI